MKKFCSIALAVIMVFALVACGAQTGTRTPTDAAAPVAENAVALLTKIWDSYAEDEKFSVIGGDFSEANLTDGAPGKYSTQDAEAIDNALGIPAASVEKIDDAASIVHMMNANTFTCAAYHVTAAEDMQAVEDGIKENVMNRQWMCGFPDKLVVIAVGDYIISAFGNEELIENLKTKTAAAYENSQIVCEESLL